MTSRWSRLPGAARGSSYAARFDQLAARGHDVHGEASFCARLVPDGARVLDAGCGTGRVAVRLSELGYECTGVDLPPGQRDAEQRRKLRNILAVTRIPERALISHVSRSSDPAVETTVCASAPAATHFSLAGSENRRIASFQSICARRREPAPALIFPRL